ncbi:lantibiotic dehydratase [Streptomyces flavotricini]|uniref:Lantibiotic dehydratase n=1 Tax=Streptomyces flavotricini TaxID=66888 RepID=A0ABS8E0Z4_9ACTN|nr:lantibiotic dehydratase [Streptomyces flavotricini]MCC0094628.1 lantibiotic dehydratase [Streptomyces flavotricini]
MEVQVASPAFRSSHTALVRAVTSPTPPLLPWPDLADRSTGDFTGQVPWLRAIRDTDTGKALRHASPALGGEVDGLLAAERPRPRDVRRAALSVARYIVRAHGRPTPFGYFAGVTTAGFGTSSRADWGREHLPVARASAEWMAEVIARLEADAELLERIPVVANTTLIERGDRLVVPYRTDTEAARRRAVEASVRMTGAVAAVLTAARAPIPVADVVAKVLAEFPSAGKPTVHGFVRELMGVGVLVSALHAPSTETDALGYLLTQLDTIGADEVVGVSETLAALGAIHDYLHHSDRHEAARAQMRAFTPRLRRDSVAVDMRLAGSVVLPEEVAREAERAALLLARVSPAPFGTTAWKAFHMRFYERFGIGSMVPVLDVVADSGIGYPDGYPGAGPADLKPRLTDRDQVLLRLGQQAALDGRREVVLDEATIEALTVGSEPVRLPPHLELGFRLRAPDTRALERGNFRLEVVSVSRGAGVGTGRFLPVLDSGQRQALIEGLSDLPASDQDTIVAQLSFPPLLPESAHVTRTPRVLPTVISLAEHRPPGEDVLTVDDLAVGCDGRRMYLAAPGRGQRVEAVGMHALNLDTHTPPLARFLTELGRAQCAQVTTFDWGAASHLPYLPRLRTGRIILAPARWRLNAGELPAADRSWEEWDAAFGTWRDGRKLPLTVHVGEGDRLLPLDLTVPAHRALLREELDRAGAITVAEAPAVAELGWCGGRAHEIVVPLKANRPPAWPRLPQPTSARTVRRDLVHTPAVSPVLLASVYGDIRRQDVLLEEHLPDLLKRLGGPPWWFVRFRDPDQHLRLRFALPTPEAFAATASTVSAWADELRRAGLVSDLLYATSYPEMGRWGEGPAWAAAEEVFRADSRAVLTQLTCAGRPSRRALIAAHSVAIAAAYLGSTAKAMAWLIDHIPPAPPARVARPEFTEAVALANPDDGWAALRSVADGETILNAWSDRSQALATYRNHFPGPDTQGIDVDDVLTSLLHVHFVRAVAVDFAEEAVCLYLTRAAALAWTARRSR